MKLTSKHIVYGAVVLVLLIAIFAGTPATRQLFDALNRGIQTTVHNINRNYTAEQEQYQRAIAQLEFENVQLKDKLAQSRKKTLTQKVDIAKLKGDKYALSQAFNSLGHQSYIAECR